MNVATGFVACLFLISTAVPANAQDGEDFYTWEINSNIDYNTTKGNVDSGSGETKISQDEVSASLSVGFFASKNVEPYAEIVYVLRDNSVGSVKSSGTVSDYGIGMLFNLPQWSKPSEKGKVSRRDVSWIPYGGVMLSSRAERSKSGEASTSDLKDNSAVTKIVFGVRYMLFEHVALNMSARLFFQDTQSEGKAASSTKGTKKTTTIEANLFSVSLLL